MKHRKQIRALFRWWRAAGLILIAVMVAGPAAPFTQAAPGAQGANILRIGYLGMPGSQTANGAQLAIDQINSSGGVAAPDGTGYQLELLTLDAVPTVDTMPNSISQLVTQDVSVLLGPDTNAQITPDTIQELVAAGRPVLTPATADAITDMDSSNLLFRTRAPERILSNAVATYLTSDLGLVNIVAVQTEVEFTEPLMEFEDALSRNSVTLADKIQLPSGDALVGETQRLLNLNPQAIVMWGAYQDAATLLDILRGNNWPGVFVYRKADEAVQADVLSPQLADGVLGMTSWSYGDPLAASGIFLRDYIVAFGEVPEALAAAAYDAIWLVRFAIAAQGATPASIQAGLIGASPRTLVQGVFHPIDFSNGDLVRIGVVYKLGSYGGPSVVARFDDTTRLELQQAGITPTETPPPAATETAAVPETTALPTATLQGTWVEVTANALNVRNGPGFEYDKIGQVKAGEQYRVLGSIADYSWVAIDFQGGVGWVKTEFTTILGDLGAVTIIQPPPSPTPAASPSPTLPPQPDLVIDSVVLNPPDPIPNRPFTATVTVRNAGGAAVGRFAVAATWEPGSVYSATFVDGMAGGQSAQAFLTPTLGATGTFQVAIVADLNNDVAEANESNNLYNLTYRVDYPLYANQSGVQVSVGQQLDLYGGTADLQWDGYTLSMVNGSKIGQLAGVTYENVTYDMLNPAVVNYDSSGFGSDKVQTGAVLAFITAEGKRAVMRVDNLQAGGPIWLSYRVYNDTP
ncbi:MAG TPA: CARDB domain-containing protein [Aggregatilineaceae bacterium]|nr:CARDB domain-containing protein [Aggregatilineaceae bacterium]